ncbi:unnamed protein product [Rotaria sp. Silwood1]|nr:unnamed protein product [Rotaria sp. Silwood1]
MEETPHLVAHFMAAGAEKRLEDYHFLRNTYETITGQEIQLNRILRMLGEDEFALSWRTDFLPIGRAYSRSVYDFDRWRNTVTLQGNIAYERLRDLEHDYSKHTNLPTIPSSSRRVQELRERRKRFSEQRDHPSSSRTRGGSVSSSARLQALAEYDTALAESEAKRKRQAEENRLNTPKTDADELIEKRHEKFKTMFDDAASQKYEKSQQQQVESKQQQVESKQQQVESKQQQVESKQQQVESKQQEIESNKHLIDNGHLIADQKKNLIKDQANDSDKIRKSSIEYDQEKSGAIELISFTVDWEPISSTNENQDEQSSLIRLKCQWASPSSSSAIDYFTIERQLGDNEWLPIGEQINKLENQAQLDISLLNDNDNNEINVNIPSYFRLKAHLQNGQTFTSKPTDEIFINLFQDKNIIIPHVEILSSDSVQLTWNDKKNEEKPNIYDIEKKEEQQPEWEKVIEVPLSQRSARIDSLTDAKQCQFRLTPSTNEPEEMKTTDNEVEPEVLTVHNVNEWLNSLHINPTSPNTVDINISEEGFKEFDCYKIEYTTIDQLDQWIQISDITHDDPQLTIDKLKQGTDYKFRFTPILPGTATTSGTDTSQLSLVLDVKMPSARKGRFAKTESETPVAVPPRFSIQKLDSTSVLIEASVPGEEPAAFEDVFDVYSKNQTTDDDWNKVGTIDKEHLSTKVENLEENAAYSFKIDNITSSSDDNESNTVQEFKFETTSVKQYDPSLLLEKIEQSLENVVNNVMQAAAGHQTLEEPVNKSLNEVIKEVFRDETLLPSEQYGFDTLALNDDLLLYRGPKQMMLKELEVDETIDLSQHYGEIIIHNYRTTKQSVIVREDNGNTRVENIAGDIIIRNVVSDVLLKNEQTHHQLSMNIVGQAFLKGVQGTLVASKFKGIIVVKNVNKP